MTPIVIDLPPSSPLEPPAEGLHELWEDLYESLGFHRDADEENEFALRKFCKAVCAPIEPIHQLTREREGQKGWTVALDPWDAPEEVLPWLAQFTGVIIAPNMTPEEIRAEIAEPTGWKRGQAPSIRLVASRELTGGKRVIIRTRTPSVGRTYIRVLKSECPNPERTETALRAALPAWELMDFAAIDGVTWADIEAGWEDFTELTGAFESFKDLTEVLPTELPEP